GLPRLVQQLLQMERNDLEIRQESREIVMRQRSEQEILNLHCCLDIQPSCQRGMARGLVNKSGQVLIDRAFEAAQRSNRAVVIERQQLHHVHAADMPYRIDPEFRVENTCPAHTARAAETLRRRIVGGDLKSQAEFVLARA